MVRRSVLQPHAVKLIVPPVTRAASVPMNPEIARKVVVLPAPLAPRIATTWPLPTLIDTPLSARITRLYTTSRPRTVSTGATLMAMSPVLRRRTRRPQAREQAFAQTHEPARARPAGTAW